MKHYDYLLVGAGLYCAAFARLATQAGKTCLVLEKRDHIGGNVYCEGINVHKYGTHSFHTSNRKVWDFVNPLAELDRYTNYPVNDEKTRLCTGSTPLWPPGSRSFSAAAWENISTMIWTRSSRRQWRDSRRKTGTEFHHFHTSGISAC